MKTIAKEARIPLGMVGGGIDAGIGKVHRIAARLDDQFELVAGALSSTPEKSKVSGAMLGLDPARSYASYEEMAEREAARPDGIRAVTIVTPNHLHCAAAEPFLKRGIHVICDKPLTATMEEAARLERAVAESGALFILTHAYVFYGMVQEARAMVAAGKLGKLRIVQVEYAQDWLTDPVEQSGTHKQAEWRMDPARSGAGGTTGDIGTHAYNLACFVSGLKGEELAAELHSFGPGRQLDDNGHVLLRFRGGARGMLWCSQVAPGCVNYLRLRLFGDKGGLEWMQEEPDQLWYTRHGEAKQLILRNGAGSGAEGRALSRVPAGHPEGYIECFANIYAASAGAIRAVDGGMRREEAMGLLPGISDGLAGMRFVNACVRSSRANSAWIRLAD